MAYYPKKTILEQTISYVGTIDSNGRLYFYKFVKDYMWNHWHKGIPNEIAVQFPSSKKEHEQLIRNNSISTLPYIEPNTDVKIILRYSDQKVSMKLEEV